MFSNVKILDCTLRDGGLGLEDAYKNGISDTRFELDDYYKLIEHLRDSKADIVELGSIEITEDDRTGFGIYRDVESISKVIIPPADFTYVFYRKIGTRRANAISKLSLSAACTIVDGVIVDFRASSGAAGPKVARGRDAEAMMKGLTL